MIKSLKIFIGYDSREKIAYHVLSQSIIANSSIPVEISAINLRNIKNFYNKPKAKIHSTEFSISRFLTPYMSDYKGYSLYLDCDFIILEDIAKLIKIISKKPNQALWCVKHKNYKPKAKTKFLTEKQIPYVKKNWSSFMIFNNAKCKILTPKLVSKASGLFLHQFKWTKENLIEALPSRWNILVGEQTIPKKINALHYTLGGPYFRKHSKCPGANYWFKYKKKIFE